jgi:hypothetical protein
MTSAERGDNPDDAQAPAGPGARRQMTATHGSPLPPVFPGQFARLGEFSTELSEYLPFVRKNSVDIEPVLNPPEA